MSLYDWGDQHDQRRPTRSPRRSPARASPKDDYDDSGPAYSDGRASPDASTGVRYFHPSNEYPGQRSPRSPGFRDHQPEPSRGRDNLTLDPNHKRSRSKSRSSKSREPSPVFAGYLQSPYGASGLPSPPPPHTSSPWHVATDYPHSPPPPPAAVQPIRVIACNSCGTDITNRPRVHCLQCPNYDLCSLCFTDRKSNANHELRHKQQTLMPSKPMLQKIPNPRASHSCGVCHDDLTSKERISCSECKKYDLCLDCNLIQATSGTHERSHRVFKIAAASMTTLVLMSDDGTPSELFQRIIDDMFDYVDANFKPRGTGVMEPEKLSAFYRKMGMSDEDNIGLFPDDKIAFQYSSMRCQYILISNKHDEITARATAWTIDALDTVPRTPALTRIGWARFLVVCSWRAPSLMYFMVKNAIELGKVREKSQGEDNTYYRWYKVSREAFPRNALGLGHMAIKS